MSLASTCNKKMECIHIPRREVKSIIVNHSMASTIEAFEIICKYPLTWDVKACLKLRDCYRLDYAPCMENKY